MRQHLNAALLLLLLSLLAFPASAQTGTQLTQSVVAGGGGASTAGPVRLDGTVGQGTVGTSSGGTFSLEAGFPPSLDNRAPVNTVPGAQSVPENGTLTFGTSNGNTISVADADAQNAPVRVTLTATNGTLTLPGTSGLNFTSGDGTSDATMTFTGSVTNVNDALNGLVFTPTAGFSGAASLQIVTNDQGHTGAGGALSDTDSVNITVNEGGTLSFSTNAYSAAEGSGSAAITIRRTGGASGEASVSFSTGGGTAADGPDYTSATQTVTFADGDAADKTVNISIADDSEYEGPETVGLALTNAAGAGSLGDTSTATLTIDDNDAVPAALVVNTTNDIDDGYCTAAHCSLREAINAANQSAGANTIGFNIQGQGVVTISPELNLPPVTEALTIDGYTQPGARPNTLDSGTDALPLVELDGGLITAEATGVGIDLASGGSTVRGLVVNRFNLAGLRSQSNAGGNLIEGNFIGTSADGTKASANAAGVVIDNSSNNTVGGTTPAARNLISGNTAGGVLVSGDSSGNKVRGNLIGTKADGTGALGNGQADSEGPNGGVLIDSGANTHGNVVGGTEAGAGNVIAFNYGGGVVITGAQSSAGGNAVLSNNVFSNPALDGGTHGLGIDLGFDGATPNDAGDGDAGVNDSQNSPVLTSAVTDAASTVIQGTLDSTPNTEFRLEFFSNGACDGSGGGEGQTFIGSKNVTTGGDGQAAFSFTPAHTLAGNQVVTATATGPGDNTSEFSRCLAVEAPRGTLQFSSTLYTAGEGGGAAVVTVTRTGGSNGAVSVRYATSMGVAKAGVDYYAAQGTLDFQDGQTSRTITITLLDDSLNEAGETIKLTLTNPVGGASLGSPAQANLIITDDDPEPSLSVNNVTVTEGNGGTANAIFTVTLSPASGRQVIVAYSTANGTATAPADYAARSGLLAFNEGETVKQIVVPVNGDLSVEADEQFFLSLTNASGATVADGQGVGTITNNDRTFSISGRIVVGATPLGGAAVTLRGSKAAATTTDADGNYTFTGLAPGGNYIVTPSKTHYTFTPPTRTFTNLSADQVNQNFAATLKTYTVGGTVKLGTAGLAGVTVKVTSTSPAGFAPRTFTTTSTGAYSFANLPAGRTYVVTPTKLNYQFTPAARTYSNLGANQPAANFAAALKTYSISGRITKPGTTTGISGVTVTITSATPAGFVPRTVLTNSAGGYTFTGLPAGRTYTIKPALGGYTFTSQTKTFVNLSSNQAAGPASAFTGTR
ncbi:MAG TPA: Calx-beta domain-containing protein [Pyrinomonadaceae bacterium]|nr:Calx-beta domain-containing protein [Pyrinomonadaceae bacterium]